MYSATRSYGPGRFRSSPQRSSSYGRPSSIGRFSGSRRSRTGLLGSDMSLFIKKAQESVTAPGQIVTHSFADFKLLPFLNQNIVHKGYKTPTPIQDQAIEPILAGRDLIGVANTGTGKTAAFIIPIVNKLFQNPTQKALIVTPTRELAFQIREELRNFAYGTRITSALVIGGESMGRQIEDLRRGGQVVIATPGRLKDLIQRKHINLHNYSTFVLDEVDMMVDIGFINDVKYFLTMLPSPRQSLFFSATFSSKVNEVLRSFVNNPITVSVKQAETLGNIEQNIIRSEMSKNKVDQLQTLLASEGFCKVLIFCRTKHGIDNLHKHLLQVGFKVGALHGNKSQGVRQQVLNSFKQDRINILLATDLASRGLDINNVSHVINYDLPATYEDYVHRIGRTGRAGKPGIALTFVD